MEGRQTNAQASLILEADFRQLLLDSARWRNQSPWLKDREEQYIDQKVIAHRYVPNPPPPARPIMKEEE